jgi:hypothetical protein
MTLIEFYEGNVVEAKHPFAHVRDGEVPRAEEMINIRKVTYRVERVTWALDDAGGPNQQWRANVELKRLSTGQE